MQLNLFEPQYFKVSWRFRAATLDAGGNITEWSHQSYHAEARTLFTEQQAMQLKAHIENLINYAGGFRLLPVQKPIR